ncbi:molybdenum cofactor biosynthesis protein, partial [Fusobacterium nucleatum]
MSDKYSVGVLTISDRSYRGEREDLGGPILIELIEKLGFEVKNFKIVPDERINIR